MNSFLPSFIRKVSAEMNKEGGQGRFWAFLLIIQLGYELSKF